MLWAVVQAAFLLIFLLAKKLFLIFFAELACNVSEVVLNFARTNQKRTWRNW